MLTAQAALLCFVLMVWNLLPFWERFFDHALPWLCASQWFCATWPLPYQQICGTEVEHSAQLWSEEKTHLLENIMNGWGIKMVAGSSEEFTAAHKQE